VNCANCEDIEEVDGAIPACKTHPFISFQEGTYSGCPIPALSPKDQRLLEMRTNLISLKDLLDGRAILEIYGAGREEIELLAELEEEMRLLREDRSE
jgi:hypothetical protein